MKYDMICVNVYLYSYIYISHIYIYIFGRYEIVCIYLQIQFSPNVLDSEVASIQDINAFQLLGGSQAEHFCFRSSIFVF